MMGRANIDVFDKAHILTHDGHNPNHTVKGLRVSELREILDEVRRLRLLVCSECGGTGSVGACAAGDLEPDQSPLEAWGYGCDSCDSTYVFVDEHTNPASVALGGHGRADPNEATVHGDGRSAVRLYEVRAVATPVG